MSTNESTQFPLAAMGPKTRLLTWVLLRLAQDKHLILTPAKPERFIQACRRAFEASGLEAS